MNYPCPTCRVEGATLIADMPCGLCCPTCLQLDRDCVGAYDNYQRFNESWKIMNKHWQSYYPKKTHCGNGKPQGAFAFTLTKSPSDDLSEDDMISAVRKLMAQQSFPVAKYAWYLEYGKPETKEHPHIHGMYETESQGRIQQQVFKRIWKIWDEKVRHGAGFRGGYHRPVRDGEEYSNYIKKDFEQNMVGDSTGI